ncbi:hypothetical protein [Comamonas kerstersii]|uniref:hypothetical protein n=1 Tax=Comamonas kerstersii TaxID=225992 RepID=UPI001B329009|nr:hypothetical protein [Comamonas kerstersii]QTW18104.1 hypothetical protein H8N02_12960 [Comamonas kerstersii]
MRNTAAAQRPTQRGAWDIPARSIAQDMQHSTNLARTPKPSQYFHIPKPADTHRSQRIAKAAI